MLGKKCGGGGIKPPPAPPALPGLCGHADVIMECLLGLKKLSLLYDS